MPMSTSERACSYILGPFSLRDNTEETLRVVEKELETAGRLEASEGKAVTALLEKFRVLENHVKTSLICDDMEAASDKAPEDWTMEAWIAEALTRTLEPAFLRYDSLDVGAVLEERRQEATTWFNGSGQGPRGFVARNLDNYIAERVNLQRSARALLDSLIVTHGSHPEWGGSAGVNAVQTMSASSLPRNRADFESSWRLTDPVEHLKRALLHQEKAQRFLTIWSVDGQGEPESVSEQKTFYDDFCALAGVAALSRESDAFHSVVEQLGTGTCTVDFEKEGDFAAKWPAMKALGTKCLVALAQVPKDAKYAERE